MHFILVKHLNKNDRVILQVLMLMQKKQVEIYILDIIIFE